MTNELTEAAPPNPADRSAEEPTNDNGSSRVKNSLQRFLKSSTPPVVHGEITEEAVHVSLTLTVTDRYGKILHEQTQYYMPRAKAPDYVNLNIHAFMQFVSTGTSYFKSVFQSFLGEIAGKATEPAVRKEKRNQLSQQMKDTGYAEEIPLQLPPANTEDLLVEDESKVPQPPFQEPN